MCTYTEFVVAEPDCECVSHWVREEDCFLSPGAVGIGGEAGKTVFRAEVKILVNVEGVRTCGKLGGVSLCVKTCC